MTVRFRSPAPIPSLASLRNLFEAFGDQVFRRLDADGDADDLRPRARRHALLIRQLAVSGGGGMDDQRPRVAKVGEVGEYLDILHQLHVSGKLSGPYLFPSSFINNIFFPKAGNTLRGTFIPLLLSLAASVAVQQRYLIPLCHRVSYQFKGHDLPSADMVSIFLSGATLFIVAGGWIWGSISTKTGEPLFGEFHEDVVQLLFALAGMCGGLAFGMPWGLIPLPILAFLGLSLWLTTRLVSSWSRSFRFVENCVPSFADPVS